MEFKIKKAAPISMQIGAGGAHVLEWDVTIGTAWTAAGTNFTQDITGMTGMAATYSAEADLVAADAYDAAADEAFNKIYKMETIDGGLRVFAREALTVTLPLHVKAVY